MTAHLSLTDFLKSRPAVLKRGPIAIILVEDDAVVTETLRHHAQVGFRHILALSPSPVPLPEDLAQCVTCLHWNTRRPHAHQDAVNAILAAVPAGTWLYYCYNAEFLFFPFSETRSIGELLAFHAEERRQAMLTYVVDLYSPDLSRDPNAVSLTDAMFDRAGYFALGRKGPEGPLERQLDFHGGLRWRFEEHIPTASRRIDRIALFRAAPDLRIGADRRFNIPEYNTYSCPWHHNLTAAIASFRAAKALATNPGSREAIGSFRWRNSEPFQWRAQQLMELGLIEPGQWF
ncbi:glycosyltransferase family 2 protein [Paracoccus benzoatiresistens]|uniref:Glycosyltransferase family 2 protein n=1 Tax=Paracoccus benzoatiresistens TaxID=2997341 RepID=A0ABT4J392_9RHOB|nr:glycosyltransferase family 2 protein [Paracoccus sp. EF6]MCZ0961594.1 glycosyltransferase family 2 protein [Paracoccus sp. EF6]